MSISSTGLYGSATIVNSDLFNDVEALKEQETTLSTSYLTTTKQHRDDIPQNRLNISQNRLNISQNRQDISQNTLDISQNTLDISKNTLHTYVCMYIHMYVVTCYVLPNPPIPSSPSNHIANLHNLLCLHRERADPRLNLFFIFLCDYIVKIKNKV